MTNRASRDLQLGLFSLNLDFGGTMAKTPTSLRLSWPEVRSIARRADQMGLEALVPVGRWKGFGGTTNYGGTSYDTLCWAAGLAAATERIRVMSTVHMPAIHPIAAAKQLTTIDHISGGRAGVNVVAGWFRPELEMFGHDMLEHDRRYDLADEWLTLLKRLWTEAGEFDHDGEFFSVRGGFSEPKPLQTLPPIMNASGSGRGQRFAAEHSDMVFLQITKADTDAVRAQVDDYKRFARAEFGRDIQVWSYMTVIPAQTTAAAQDLERGILAAGDYEAVRNLLGVMGIETQTKEGVASRSSSVLEDRFVEGWGAPTAVGDADTIAERLAWISDCGLDGALLIFPDWGDGLERFGADVLPRLAAAGVRRDAAPVS